MPAARQAGYRGAVAEEPAPPRQWASSWLGGIAGNSAAYPGEALGLPREGPRSVASMGRQLVALMVDWVACLAIAMALDHARNWVPFTQDWTLVIFALETWLLTGLTGFTLGKRLLRIRVARLDGKPVGLGWALLRTLLLLLIVPPLVTDRDLRGLHDRAASTVVIRV